MGLGNVALLQAAVICPEPSEARRDVGSRAVGGESGAPWRGEDMVGEISMNLW